MFSFEEIYQAYLECRKNKRNTINALKFELNLLDNLWELHYSINSFRYKPRRYIYFLTHSPKLREVFASDFRDRVVHHLLVRDLEPIFEPLFIYDSYSCRKNRGTHLAIKRLERFVRNRDYPYYLRYVDDFVILGRSKEELGELKMVIADYLERHLKLQLRKSYALRETKKGIDFLGYIVKPSHTLVRQRVVNNFKYKKAKFLDSCFVDGTCSFEDAMSFKEINASFYGHAKHADSYRLMEKYQVGNWLSGEK